MVDDKEFKKRISFLKNEAEKYILVQKKDFDEAFSSNFWLPLKKQKDFEKTLRSGSDTAGFQSVLTAGGRRAAMLWWMGRYLIHAKDDLAQGYEYLHRGLDAIWWGFLCRPNTYTDLESNIQLLIAWFDVTGVPKRSDYIGRYLSGLTEIPDREKYLQNSEIGRLMAQLWCKDNSIDIEYLTGIYEFKKKDHKYANVIENIFSEDVGLFTSILESALQYRVREAAIESGEFRTAIAFHLIPIEFYYIQRIRSRKGLVTNFPESAIFSLNDGAPSQYSGISLESDPVLHSAIKKAIDQKWLGREMVEEMM